jgi:pilus assembly protein CpaE
MGTAIALSGKSKDDGRNASLVVFVADKANKDNLAQSLGQLGVTDAYVARGGIDAAITHLGRMEKPPLRLIVDISGLDNPLAALDRLAEACDPSVQVYAVGVTNDVTLYRALLEAGICDYRFKPVTVDALRTWLTQDGGHPVRKARSGKVIAVTGTRGGVGVTSVAAHLASHLTAGSGLRRVVYLDMDLYGGASSTLLGMAPNHAMFEALKNVDRLDPQFLQRTLTTKDGRLFVLAFNQNYADTATPEAGAAAQLLEVLAQHFHYVVVDLPRPGGVVANEVFGQASVACVVSDRSVHSAHVLTRLISHIEARPNAPVLHWVVNASRAPARSAIDSRQVAQAVSHPVALDIAYDPKAPALAEDLGEPLAPSSDFAKAIGKLALKLTGELASNGKTGSRIVRWLRRTA